VETGCPRLKFCAAFYPQNDGQTRVVNWSLGNHLRCLVGEKTHTWDLVLPLAELAYNAMNKSTGKSPFAVVDGVVPRLPIDLVPLPIDSQHAKFAETFLNIFMMCMPIFNKKLHRVMKIINLLQMCIVES